MTQSFRPPILGAGSASTATPVSSPSASASIPVVAPLTLNDIAPGAPKRGRSVKQVIVVAAFLAAGGAGVYYGNDFWSRGRFLVSTDDAYVMADYTTIAPKISGYIADVRVHDNQRVRAGDVLATIDDRDFRAALAQAEADLEAADASVRNLDAQAALQQSLIAQEQAKVAATRASLDFARTDAVRYATLARSGTTTQQKADATRAEADQLAADLLRDQAAVSAAQAKIGVLATERDKALAQKDRARASLEQAKLNLSYATITAPVDGTIGARTLRVGQYVGVGTQLMAVVPLDAIYVVANFKETQLTRVRDGQSVSIAVDGFPGVKLKGHVDSLSPASGLSFALLPPDNATGNFTKIVQRIPVKIVVDDRDLAGLLRAGMSVEPTIDTKTTEPAKEGQSG